MCLLLIEELDQLSTILIKRRNVPTQIGRITLQELANPAVDDGWNSNLVQKVRCVHARDVEELF